MTLRAERQSARMSKITNIVGFAYLIIYVVVIRTEYNDTELH